MTVKKIVIILRFRIRITQPELTKLSWLTGSEDVMGGWLAIQKLHHCRKSLSQTERIEQLSGIAAFVSNRLGVTVS